MRLNQVVDELHKAMDFMDLKLPKYVQLCPICDGRGEYQQSYNAGCGGGMYRSTGPCDYCKIDGLWYQGTGFRYKDSSISRRSVPESVIFQIYEMNKNPILVKEQLEE